MQIYWKSRLLNTAFLDYCLDHCYYDYKMTFKLDLITNPEKFPSKMAEIYDKIHYQQFLIRYSHVKWFNFISFDILNLKKENISMKNA